MSFKPPCDDAVILSAPFAAPCAEAVRKWVLITAILGSSIAFIDGTVVNVALPALQRGLRATMADVQWVVEIYALFFAALLLVGGSLGDRFGRRRVYAIGVALFTAASIGCGLAPDIRQLLIARAVQGVGAALLVPGSLALIGASFPASERGKAIGTWSAFSAITTAIGPVLGGWLIEHASWRWAFFLNVPVAAVVILILILRVPESRATGTRGRLDWAGAVFVTLGLGGVVYALTESSRLGWTDPRVIVGFVVGTLALAGFAFAEARLPHPMMPLDLFRSRNFSGANLLTLLLYGALGGAFFFLPLILIQVHGYSATAAGAAMLPFIVILFLLSRWSGSLVDRFGARGPMVVGPALAALGFALLAVPGTTGGYWSTFLAPIVVIGLGMAVCVAPLTTTVMNSIDARHVGVASGVNNAVSRVASLLAIALLGVLVIETFGHEMDRRLASLHLAPTVVASLEADRTRLGAIEAPPDVDASDRTAIRVAVNGAFVAGFRLMALAAAALALASAVVAGATIVNAEPAKLPGTAG